MFIVMLAVKMLNVFMLSVVEPHFLILKGFKILKVELKLFN
jgi:hypothetical protein